MFEFDFNYLLTTYGYYAILLLTFLEGETIVIIAGFLASKGLMNPYLIAICAFCGSFTSDQLMFFIGKYKGPAVLRRFPRLNRNVEKASRMIMRYENPLILGFRFLYGVRNVTPILLGIGQVSHTKFIILNFIGGVIWAAAFTAGGYFIGEVFVRIVEHAGKATLYVILGLVVVLALVWYIRRKLRARRAPVVIDEAATEEALAAFVQSKQEGSSQEMQDSPATPGENNEMADAAPAASAPHDRQEHDPNDHARSQ